jgi:hypothetical protein
MLMRGIAVLATMMVLAPEASAGSQPGILHRVSCTVVRYYVAKYSASAAEMWARSHGATDAEIDAARQCLKEAPAQAAQNAHWTGQ